MGRTAQSGPFPCASDMAADRADQRAARGVTAQLPEEGATEPLALRVPHLAGDRAGCVEAPPLATVEAVGGAGDNPAGLAVLDDLLVVVDARLVQARRRAGRLAARLLLGHAGPAAAVETDAQQQLAT